MTGEPQATDRAAVVAGITAKIEELLGADPGAIKPDEPLGRQVDIDSLDAAEIAIALEEMLFADDTSAVLDLQADWTIDRIADDIMAKLEDRR